MDVLSKLAEGDKVLYAVNQSRKCYKDITSKAKVLYTVNQSRKSYKDTTSKAANFDLYLCLCDHMTTAFTAPLVAFTKQKKINNIANHLTTCIANGSIL